MTSNSLILVGNGTRQFADGTLIRRGVGLTVAQIMGAGGKIVTRVLNVGYSGPNVPKRHIHQFFSEAEQRECALDELHKADWGNLTKPYAKLQNHCRDLLKYALPEYVLLRYITVRRALIGIPPDARSQRSSLPSRFLLQ